MRQFLKTIRSNVQGKLQRLAIIALFQVIQVQVTDGLFSPPPDIQIAWNDIILNKERIYIDEYLLAGHKRMAKGQITSGTQDAEHHTHSHEIDNEYTLR